MGRGPGATAPAPVLLGLLLLLLVLTGLALTEEEGPARPGRRRRLPSSSSSEGGPTSEVVEGCFNRFDTMVEVPMESGTIVGLFNNVRCQAECGERGYALAATRSSPQACLCGNDYPTSFHQVGVWGFAD